MKTKLSLLAFLLSVYAFAQIPAGYYNAATGSGYALKTQLYNKIKNHNSNGYAGLWITYETSDRDNQYENDNTLFDLYSENPTGLDPVTFLYSTNQCGNYTTQGDCYNREHIVPQSIFNSASPMVADAHSTIPVDGFVNGQRSDNPHGNVAVAAWTSLNGSKRGTSAVVGYTGTVFEPLDDFKGDIARMYFYFATRYEDVVATYTNYPMFNGTGNQVFTNAFLTMLLSWHSQDPVSAREIARNNAIYDRQNNRNPFVDHPEYAGLIWGETGTLAQTITFDALANMMYGNSDFNLTATASSGLTVSYVSSNNNVATIAGNVVTIVGVGTTTITAFQPGDTMYGAAPSVNQSLTITPAILLQWNTFGNLGTETAEQSTANNAGIAATTLNFTGSSVIPSSNGNRFGGNTWAVGTVNTSNYIQFTVTPNAGFSFTPISFDFIWDFSTTGPKSVALRSSVDNYVSNLGSLNNMTASTTTVKTILISSLSNISTPATFRLYGFDATSASGTGGFDCTVNTSNVTLSGTTTLIPIPVIAATGTLAALATTYGAVSSETSFNVSGTNMATGISVIPPAGYEVSLTSGSGYAPSITVGTSGTIISTPVFVRLSATASVFGSPYSGAIVLSSTGAANVNVATLPSSVAAKPLTIAGITANNKIFDGNTTTTISGTAILVGVVNSDSITLGGNPVVAFANTTAGNGINVLVTGYTMNGTDSGNYILIQPTNLAANIIPKGITVSATAANKVYNGSTIATITGILNGVVGSDVVTFNATGTFASPNVGVGIAVTATASISGANAGNYILTQPTALTANITPKVLTIE